MSSALDTLVYYVVQTILVLFIIGCVIAAIFAPPIAPGTGLIILLLLCSENKCKKKC